MNNLGLVGLSLIGWADLYVKRRAQIVCFTQDEANPGSDFPSYFISLCEKYKSQKVFVMVYKEFQVYPVCQYNNICYNHVLLVSNQNITKVTIDNEREVKNLFEKAIEMNSQQKKQIIQDKSVASIPIGTKLPINPIKSREEITSMEQHKSGCKDSIPGLLCSTVVENYLKYELGSLDEDLFDLGSGDSDELFDSSSKNIDLSGNKASMFNTDYTQTHISHISPSLYQTSQINPQPVYNQSLKQVSQTDYQYIPSFSAYNQSFVNYDTTTSSNQSTQYSECVQLNTQSNTSNLYTSKTESKSNTHSQSFIDLKCSKIPKNLPSSIPSMKSFTHTHSQQLSPNRSSNSPSLPLFSSTFYPSLQQDNIPTQSQYLIETSSNIISSRQSSSPSKLIHSEDSNTSLFPTIELTHHKSPKTAMTSNLPQLKTQLSESQSSLKCTSSIKPSTEPLLSYQVLSSPTLVGAEKHTSSSIKPQFSHSTLLQPQTYPHTQSQYKPNIQSSQHYYQLSSPISLLPHQQTSQIQQQQIETQYQVSQIQGQQKSNPITSKYIDLCLNKPSLDFLLSKYSHSPSIQSASFLQSSPIITHRAQPRNRSPKNIQPQIVSNTSHTLHASPSFTFPHRSMTASQSSFFHHHQLISTSGSSANRPNMSVLQQGQNTNLWNVSNRMIQESPRNQNPYSTQRRRQNLSGQRLTPYQRRTPSNNHPY